MRTIIVSVTSADVPGALSEAQDVANVLTMAGHRVRLVTGDDASLNSLVQALDHGPFDLIWLITHSDPAGFALADQVVSPAQLGQWLRAAGCRAAVLNSCHSAEHVVTLQRACAADIVATIDTAGVDGVTARSTGIYLARALVMTGDLREAVERASGSGLVQYRWYPAGTEGAMRNEGSDAELARTMGDLVRALQGDPFSGAPGLLAQLNALNSDMRQYMAETDRRLKRLEAQRVNPLSLLLLAAALAPWLLLAMR